MLPVLPLTDYTHCSTEVKESCGIAVNNVDENGNIKIIQYKDMGLVQEVFNSLVLNELKGHASVGHVRYTTAGSSSRENAQPLVSRYQKGTFALAHNGNLVDIDKMPSRIWKIKVRFSRQITTVK